MKAVATSFAENIKSNSFNHGYSGHVSLMDKFHEVIEAYYFTTPTFILLILALLFWIGRSVFQKKPNVPAIIGLFGIINLNLLVIFS